MHIGKSVAINHNIVDAGVFEVEVNGATVIMALFSYTADLNDR